MSFESDLLSILKKIDKMEGDAKFLFRDRLGQLEDDLANDDLEGAAYAAGFLLKALEQSNPAYKGGLSRMCDALAVRISEGDTHSLTKSFKRNRIENDIELLRSSEGTDPKDEFERDLKRLPLEAQDLIRRWNDILSLPRVHVLSGRVTTIKRAFRSTYFRAHWSDALPKLARSKFLTGGGKTRWKADIDWFLKPGSIEKIMEGAYEEKSQQTSIQHRTYEQESI